ncbi:hypothetical protein COMNV_00121 [Commensalibacter sp. Nvir]|uniref:protoporphyrinogen/coproporphyrinogen oxidase n=1 Tax=Commensalibacter sp. Nvir TaxID=3069817 RepID=UPI002D428B54|nr:hypothetical protein COMNV_00121 [Commensalibacter sp. Nvir]
MHEEVTILGSGIAGLSAYARAQELDLTAKIYEATSQAGGLMNSFTLSSPEGDWLFDNAVHLSFATELEVRAIFDRTPYLTHEPKALNFDAGYWLSHPVQNNMFVLPASEKADLLVDLAQHLAERCTNKKVGNYREWLVDQYGVKIAERWPLRYTRKYWTIQAEEMGTKWIGSRMRVADLWEVAFGAMSAETPNTYYVSSMRYPKQGGYRSFLNSLLKNIDLYCDCRAVGINTETHEILFNTGNVCSYTNLVSTIPLPYLVSIIDNVPSFVRENAKTLYATSIDLVSIGLNKPNIAPSLWFYIYDEDILAARVYSPSWKSPKNAPPNCSSLQFEIYSSRQKKQHFTPNKLIEHCLMALEKMQIASRNNVILTHHKHIKFGNVVFDKGMEERRNYVRHWVESRGITVAGRFGEWDYLWSNQAFMSGLNAINKIVSFQS